MMNYLTSYETKIPAEQLLLKCVVFYQKWCLKNEAIIATAAYKWLCGTAGLDFCYIIH